MRKLKIHFTKNSKNKIFSRLIRWYEGTDFSHCAIEFDLPKLDMSVIYHSSAKSGVNFCSKKLFLRENTIVDTFELSIEDNIYKLIMKQLILNCGKRYAFTQNLGILLVNCLKKLGVTSKNPFIQSYNCSELVYTHVISNVYGGRFHFDSQLVTPKNIYSMLKELQHTDNIT